ncbi:acyltransferase family protein [Nocardioides litoris]|uniref:acyltransferase family protein n=1 Tax=Nocardioides litoris TaxID=1926648 RepID=UPI00111E2E39|nr:acyltransferase family protein [Nocardioides litoris]
MTMGTTDAAPAFRTDVQGMRAVAVLAVIAAHAAVPGMGGGFVGVDVFFVISGYLITRLILGSIETDGRFRIGAFYARRARRIVPAATVVLAVTMVASVIYLNFLDVIDASRDAAWAAFFAANIRFATQGVDYFALEESPSPVQHYWSLAVEEQFYIVWPLLVGLAMLLTRRRSRRAAAVDGAAVKRAAPVRTMALLALAVGAASLAWSVHRTVEEPTSAYFSTLTRAWELAAGVIVALLLHRRAGLRQRWITEPVALAGLVGIVVAVVAYDTTMAFPGYEALLPVLSTVGLVVAGAHDGRQPLVSRALSLAPMRKIGDWSYSLYLWHWPIIVVPQVHMGRPLSITETIVAVALIFQMGYLTHRFVEQPFRRGTFWRRDWRGLVLYPASLALVLPTILGGYQVAEYYGGERGNDAAITADAYGIDDGDEIISLVEASVEAGRMGDPIPSNLTPDLLDLGDDIADVGECNYQLPERPICERGDVGSDKVIVVTGDSHARAWIPAIEQIAEAAGYATYYFVKQQCTASFVDPGRLGTGAPWPECDEFHDWVVDQVERLDPDLMVVATSPPPAGVYADDGTLVTSREGVSAELATGFDDMFAAYEPLVDRLVLLEDVPRLPEEPGSCLAAHDSMGSCLFEPTSYSEEMRQVSIEAADRAGVERVDPTAWLCYDGQCPVVIGSTITYRDRSHISATRAAELWFPLGVDLGLLEDPDGKRGEGKKRRSAERSSGRDESPSEEPDAPVATDGVGS